MERKIVDFEPDLTITNLDQLPRGTGAPYLLVVDSPYPGEYVAKRWIRNLPATTQRGETVIRF